MSLIPNLFRRTPAPSAGTRAPLGRAASDAVRALAESSLAGTRARMRRVVDRTATGALDAAAEALADAVVRHALSDDGAPSTGELRERTAVLRERVRAAGAPGRLRPAQLAPVLSLVVEGMLRRAALESCGRYVELIVGLRGRMALEWRAVEPWVALGLLEADALGRAARWADADPLLAAEMEAAHWWFDGWSAPGTHAGFAQLRRMYVRTQEWALADRPASALGEPVIARLLRDGAHQGWPARQREVVERLPGSVVGVFTAREMDGAGTGVLVSAADGRELPFLYDAEVRIGAGDLLVGRLIPFGDGRWFGSFGMEAIGPDEVDAERLLRTFGELRARLPDAAALEGALTRHVYGRTAPRPVPPAEDPDDALRRLDALRAALAGRAPAGAASPAADRDEPLPALPSGDAVLASWAEALADLSRRRPPGRQRPKRPSGEGVPR